MIQYCCPTIFWKFNVGYVDLKNVEEKCVYSEYTKDWNCLVKTSRGVEYNWSHFIQKIIPYFENLSYKQGVSLKSSGDPWMNVYEKGCYQEPHHHMGDVYQLSYCYFYKLPQNSGKFCFWNEQFRLYCSNRLLQLMNLEVDEWIYPDVSEGDLIIFPSFLTHQVTYHGITDERVTVSGNVEIL